ncbi:unnamed protein product [Choristocarpus tenellus]
MVMDVFFHPTMEQKENVRTRKRSAPHQVPFLFNPQKKVSNYAPTETEKKVDNRSYWAMRTKKLIEQNPEVKSRIFAGCRLYFNGRTGNYSSHHLQKAVQMNGGITTPVYSVKGVTHIIAENLSAKKTEKAMQSTKTKVVHPDWITSCIAAGKLLPDGPFRTVRSQRSTLSFLVGSGSKSSSRAGTGTGTIALMDSQVGLNIRGKNERGDKRCQAAKCRGARQKGEQQQEQQGDHQQEHE